MHNVSFYIIFIEIYYLVLLVNCRFIFTSAHTCNFKYSYVNINYSYYNIYVQRLKCTLITELVRFI